MPAERLSMRKIREVLRLRYACGASERVIARSVGIDRTAIGEYIRRAAVIGITWPVPEELDDATLERKLFAPAGYNPPRSKPLPEWGHVHAELRARGPGGASLRTAMSRVMVLQSPARASVACHVPGAGEPTSAYQK
jgi:hypothetical protein